MQGSSHGGSSFSGTGYDRWSYEHAAPGANDSALNKLQHKFWITKQAVVRKLGKNEDEHVVASDSELDAKLELFRSINETTIGLQRWIEHYQDRLCNLSYEENSLGRFLKEYGKADKTRAGKMMVAAGKTMSYSGQQRLSIRVPLVRLYQEVETFRQRAIEDTLVTVRRMEKCRTEYRGALMWMKNVSQELDPDTYKQLEKFRKGHVKQSKARFDKMKLDCLQKVDLLAASRCNMFSHALIMYQNALIIFWEKTAKTMTHVNDSFQGYQHFEFSYIKDLAEPSRQLCQEGKPTKSQKKQIKDKEELTPHQTKEEFLLDPDSFREPEPPAGNPLGALEARPLDDELLNFGVDDDEEEAPEMACDSNELAALSMLTPSQPLERPKDTDSALLLADIMNVTSGGGAVGQPSSVFPSATSSSAAAGSAFGDQWNKVFGGPIQDTPASDTLSQFMSAAPGGDSSDLMMGPFQGASSAGGGKSSAADAGSFLPSQLFDTDQSLFAQKGEDSIQNALKDFPMPSPAKPSSVQKQLSAEGNDGHKSAKGKKADMSQWFSLFADLDPLSNPDAIGKTTKEEDVNCYS